MNVTASALYDERWGYAAILLTAPGIKKMLTYPVIQDEDIRGVSAGDLAEEYIEYMEDPRNGYDIDTWNPQAWDHALCYQEFLRRRHVWEAA